MLGLILVNFLATNRAAEFHTLLERTPLQKREENTFDYFFFKTTFIFSFPSFITIISMRSFFTSSFPFFTHFFFFLASLLLHLLMLMMILLLLLLLLLIQFML